MSLLLLFRPQAGGPVIAATPDVTVHALGMVGIVRGRSILAATHPDTVSTVRARTVVQRVKGKSIPGTVEP